MINKLAETTMSVPVGWVLASGATLAGAISFLAKLIYNSQQKQIDALRDEIKEMRKLSDERSKIIETQNSIILNLQKDIADLKRGCGAQTCLWIGRCKNE